MLSSASGPCCIYCAIPVVCAIVVALLFPYEQGSTLYSVGTGAHFCLVVVSHVEDIVCCQEIENGTHDVGNLDEQILFNGDEELGGSLLFVFIFDENNMWLIVLCIRCFTWWGARLWIEDERT